eukprot:12839130-Alexandrium_andersonii.AAC.1
MAGGRPRASVPATPSRTRIGKAARRRLARKGQLSTSSHPHACVSVRRPATWPAAGRNHWKAAVCQAPRAWPDRSSTKVGARTGNVQRAAWSMGS